ncbi:hypothetical protein [Helicobacter salomonis]|uniref:hypothetical protein n=1 Tax=Helicobacter salomonis TaxID=56878 RepID=UPI000CF08D87|nr:hypothetical protein [Helicobacter salomonis]
MQADRLYSDMARFCKNALNRAITKSARKQRQLVREQYALPNKTLRRYTKIKRASTDILEATIRNATYGLSLNNFKRLERRGGVLVKLSKNRHIFMQGGFLAAKQGSSKQRNKGFLYTRQPQNFAGLNVKAGTLRSYVHQRAPKSTQVYRYATQPFSQIARSINHVLLPETHTIFAQELARE